MSKGKEKEEAALASASALHQNAIPGGCGCCLLLLRSTDSLLILLEFNWSKYPNNETLSIFMSVLLSADLVSVYLLKHVMLVVPECNYTCKFFMLSGSCSVFQMVK